MNDFTVHIDDKRLLDAMGRLERFAGDLTPLMQAEAGIMQHAVEENFLAGGRQKWQDLKPATVNCKRREKLGHIPITILRETGVLYNSIQSEADSHHAITGTNDYRAHALNGNINGTPVIIHHPSRRGEVNLRTDRKGKPMRNARGGAILA